MSGLVEFEYRYLNSPGGGDLYFFLNISFCWVNDRLHTENEIPLLPGSDLKVCAVLGGCFIVRVYDIIPDMKKHADALKMLQLYRAIALLNNIFNPFSCTQ